MFKTPKTTKEYRQCRYFEDELKEEGYEPDNRTRRLSNGRKADEFDDIKLSALEEKHNCV